MRLFYINSQVTIISTTFPFHGHNIVSVHVMGNDIFIDKFLLFLNLFVCYFRDIGGV